MMMTVRFDFDVKKFKGNPLFADTPFGKPEAISIGDTFAERDALEEALINVLWHACLRSSDLDDRGRAAIDEARAALGLVGV